MNLNVIKFSVESSDLHSHIFFRNRAKEKQFNDDYSMQMAVGCAPQILQQYLEDQIPEPECLDSW